MKSRQTAKPLTDKQKAKKLQQAVKHLQKAVQAVDTAVPNLPYFTSMSFEWHCNSIDLEGAVAHFGHGELDPMR
jgi:hypothetical protein